MLDQLDSHKAEIIKPFPGDEPWGEDPKYEDGFSWLKEEIAKMGGMGAGATDWEKVEIESRKLLVSQAKDLNLVAYLVTSWVILFKIEGLVVGLEILAHFLGEVAWSEIHPNPWPKKRKARTLTLIWLQTQMGDRLASCVSEDRALLERGQTAVETVKTCVYARFEDPPVNFKQLRNMFEEWLARVPEPELPTPPDAGGDLEPKPSDDTTEADIRTGAGKALPDAHKPPLQIKAPGEDADPTALYEVLSSIAHQLLAADPHNPLPFLLQRVAIWSDAGLPRHEETRETFFPAPATEIVESLENMRTKAAWAALLAKAEDLTGEHWYWLDLQFYVAQAARGLGLEAITEVIESRLHQFDQALPDLKELKFNDGTPFATPPTRDWLVGLGLRAVGGSEPDPAEALLSELRQLGSDKFADAMQVAQERIRQAPDPRSAFRMRVEAARFCLEAEQYYWAESLAESLVASIEHYDLGNWEPELAARAWSVLLEVARELRETDEAYSEKERSAMKALAGLDLSCAGRFPKARPSYT